MKDGQKNSDLLEHLNFREMQYYEIYIFIKKWLAQLKSFKNCNVIKLGMVRQQWMQKVEPEFFGWVWHVNTYASSENKHFFPK